jgi:glycosyltransferase involved in cell wall biosynthesis
LEFQGKTIWCISKYAIPPKYGAQGRLFYLSKFFNKQGNKSYVITCSESHLINLPPQEKTIRKSVEYESETIFIKGLKFKNSLSKKRILSWFVFEWRLFRFILQYKKHITKPDVIIVSSMSILTIINGIIAKWKFNCKLIFEIRDIWPLSAIQIMGYSKYNPFIILLRMIEIYGYTKADYVTSTLENAVLHIQNSVKKKIKFKYIPQGYDPENFAQVEELPIGYLENNIPKNKFIITYIGNIVAAYDLESLIDCAGKIAQIDKSIHFIVLGDGTHKKKLIEYAGNLSNLSFLPRIKKSQLPFFLEKSDVVTNFLKNEPLFKFGVSPQKIIDYMYASKPILMSFSGYKTVVEVANCGIVAPSGDLEKICDAILYLKKLDPSELKKLGKNGKDYLENNLNWENISHEYSTLF